MAATKAPTRRDLAPADAGDAGLQLPFSRADCACFFIRRRLAICLSRAEAREDFERLVQALTRRNEPDPIPASMGACLVAGYNNWDRVTAFLARRAEPSLDLADAIREIQPHRQLYQDRFILLSSGPYSAISSTALGLEPSIWHEMSLRIRLEHECTHYFMRQAFAHMREPLFEELVADYAALILTCVATEHGNRKIERRVPDSDANGSRGSGVEDSSAHECGKIDF